MSGFSWKNRSPSGCSHQTRSARKSMLISTRVWLMTVRSSWLSNTSLLRGRYWSSAKISSKSPLQELKHKSSRSDTSFQIISSGSSTTCLTNFAYSMAENAAGVQISAVCAKESPLSYVWCMQEAKQHQALCPSCFHHGQLWGAHPWVPWFC